MTYRSVVSFERQRSSEINRQRIVTNDITDACLVSTGQLSGTATENKDEQKVRKKTMQHSSQDVTETLKMV